MPCPDIYRGLYREDEPEPGKKYASHVAEVIDSAQQRGRAIAGFIAEPLVGAHRDLCERLDLDPDEIAQRLNRLLTRCHYDTMNVDIYTDLLGEHADTITSPARW